MKVKHWTVLAAIDNPTGEDEAAVFVMSNEGCKTKEETIEQAEFALNLMRAEEMFRGKNPRIISVEPDLLSVEDLGTEYIRDKVRASRLN